MYANVLNTGGFFAVTNVNTLHCSVDGKNWITCPPITSFPEDKLKYVFRVDNVLIAIMTHKKFIYTFDCITWKECEYKLTDEQKELKIVYHGVDVFDNPIIGFEEDYVDIPNKYYSLDVAIHNNKVKLILTI